MMISDIENPIIESDIVSPSIDDSYKYILKNIALRYPIIIGSAFIPVFIYFILSFVNH